MHPATSRATPAATLLLVSLCVALVALSGCVGGGSGASGPPSVRAAEVTRAPVTGLDRFYGQPLDWSDCDVGECAELLVPLDYADPAGATLVIDVNRSPATGERRGTLVVNPGGPGGSGIDLASRPERAASATVREHYDIVGFDPRGVGRSSGITCYLPGALDALNAADPTPDSAAEIDDLIALAGPTSVSCEAEVPGLVARMSTVDVARDLDILRAALGQERLDYLGLSYGTHLGAIYAARFPDRVGRFVLDGPLPADLDATDLGLGQAAGFEASVREFLRRCLAGGDCPLADPGRPGAGDADVDAAVDRLTGFLSSLDAQPLPTGDPARPLTEGLAAYAIVMFQYLPILDWPLLQAGLAAALAGDGEPLLGLLDARLGRQADGTYSDNSFDAFLAVSCLDRASPTALPDAAELARWRAASPIFGEGLAWGTATRCRGLPTAPVAGTDEPRAATALPPILVIATTGDPATPYAWAEALADQLGSGIVVTREGFGHLGYNVELPDDSVRCVGAIVDRFLLDGEIPDTGIRCADDG